ncbi:MAG: AtpZ/AtpI family protein [bacterium]|nr:AtpZ/AtpI family protein [bacterium]
MPGTEDRRPGWYRHAGMGVELFGAVLGFTLVGIWIDRHFGTGPWAVVICVILGLIGGLYNLIRQSLRLLSQSRPPVRRAKDESTK